MLQAVKRALEGLVDIRVKGMVAAERTVEYACRLVEVGDVPVLFQTIQRVGDGYLMVRLQTPTLRAWLRP